MKKEPIASPISSTTSSGTPRRKRLPASSLAGSLLAVAGLVLALAPAAQAATIVGTGTSSISFDTATPTPATTAVGTPAEDYQGYVTGHDGSGVPQLTLSSSNDTTIEDPATDWDNGGQGFAPIGAWTYRDKTSLNPQPAAFSLLGSVTPTGPTTTGTASDMTEFKITGISFAVRDQIGYDDRDQVSVRILDSLSNVVSTGTLEALGNNAGANPTALNAASLQGGGIFSGDAIFAPATGHLTGPFTVQLALDENASWTNPNQAFWMSLDSAELTVDYTVPEPATTFAITEIQYDPDAGPNPTVTLTWTSQPGETFTVRYSGDMTNWESDLDDGIEADDGETTTRTFDLDEAGVAEADRLYFRVEK